MLIHSTHATRLNLSSSLMNIAKLDRHSKAWPTEQYIIMERHNLIGQSVLFDWQARLVYFFLDRGRQWKKLNMIRLNTVVFFYWNYSKTYLACLTRSLTHVNGFLCSRFPFIEPPSASSVESSIVFLKEQGALSKQEKLTSVGKLLADLPVHAVIGKMLIMATVFKVNKLFWAVVVLCCALILFMFGGKVYFPSIQ